MTASASSAMPSVSLRVTSSFPVPAATNVRSYMSVRTCVHRARQAQRQLGPLVSGYRPHREPVGGVMARIWIESGERAFEHPVPAVPSIAAVTLAMRERHPASGIP